MKVQKILITNTTEPHWIVIGDDFLPISPISEYLFFLRNTDKSIYTIRTYAHHLKIFWEYLQTKRLSWEKIALDHLAHFIATLNGLIDDNVIYLDASYSKRSERTINQIVNAVISFYQFHHRMGHVPEMPLYQWRKPFNSHKAFKPLLHHLSKSKLKRGSILKLKEKKQLPKTVDVKTIQQMVSACRHLRDKFLICLLYESGCRIGQALGLRHEDIETFNNAIIIRPRNDNLNLARAKIQEENRIHVTQELMQLYSDYYTNEYGDIDSDYVFINIWRGDIGKPMLYSAVMTLFRRLSQKFDIHVTPHMLRHTHATELIQSGWSMVYVQKRLGHQDIQTTLNTYIHLSEKDLKEQYQRYLEKRGDG